MLLWLIRSGVLQGCPLSGLLFSVATDPFARPFEKIQTSPQTKLLLDPQNTSKHNVAVRLCADDVGAAMSSILALPKFAMIFHRAHALASLQLKHAKCVLVPLFEGDLENTERQMRKLLSRFLPEWKHFKIASSAVYLGFALGPSSDATQLIKVEAKWIHRCLAMYAAQMALAPSVIAYNTYALTVWSYKAQLLHLPNHVFGTEKRMLHKLARLPWHAYGIDGLFNLSHLGLPGFKSLRALNIATLARTANKTLVSWLPLYLDLAESAEKHLSPDLIAKGLLCKPHRDSVPFLSNLFLYSKENPLAWQHLADVRSRAHDAKHGLMSSCPCLPPSWNKSIYLRWPCQPTP